MPSPVPSSAGRQVAKVALHCMSLSFGGDHYAYANANPVNGFDPSGHEEADLNSEVAADTGTISIASFKSFADFATYVYVKTTIIVYNFEYYLFMFDFISATAALIVGLAELGIRQIPSNYQNPNEGSTAPISDYEVSTYADLRDRAAANGQSSEYYFHHVPQKAWAAAVIKGYSPLPANDEPAIAIPRQGGEHADITRAQAASYLDRFSSTPTPQKLVLRDFFHLRRYSTERCAVT
jgi:hypothetical protein